MIQRNNGQLKLTVAQIGSPEKIDGGLIL